MLALFQKEINSFFNSLIAYVVMATFLVAIGLIMWVFPDTGILGYPYADLGVFFNLTPFVLLFLVPAVTMRSIAEETKNGTLELLLTRPITNNSLVLAKFLANWLLVAITIFPTTIYWYSVYQLGNPVGNIDSAAVFGSYLGLLLLSGALVSMGVWMSSVNNNQIVAFVLGVFVGFIWYAGFDALASLAGDGIVAELFTFLALNVQYQSLGKGVVDLRNVIYLISAMVFFLTLTRWQIERLRK